MVERLKPLTDRLISPTQFACHGRSISSAINILRDIFWDSHLNQRENFVISVDFIKAFDTVDRDFMMKILKKMGFQGRFLNTINNLNTNTGAKLIINGFLSKTIKQKRGVKQGDALSLFLFLIVLEPLILAIHADNNIEKIRIPGGKQVSSVNYADDANFALGSKKSLERAMRILKDFGDASGLKIHLEGDKRCDALLTKSYDRDCLDELGALLEGLHLQIQEQGLELLGTAVGTPSFLDTFFQQKFDLFKAEAKRLSQPAQNYHEKIVLAKSKLIPLLAYHCQFYGIPEAFREKINGVAKSFFFGLREPTETYPRATLSRGCGGFGMPHIVKNIEAMMLKQIFPLYKVLKERDTNLNIEMSLATLNFKTFMMHKFECHAPTSIRTTHQKGVFYERAKTFINFYGITGEEMKEAKISKIRAKIQDGNSYPGPNRNSDFYPTEFRPSPEAAETQIMNDHLFSHRLQKFLYKAGNRLLKLPNLVRRTMQANNTCYFCAAPIAMSYDHVFFSCPKTKSFWNFYGSLTPSEFTRNEIINLNFGSSQDNEKQPFWETRVFLAGMGKQVIYKHWTKKHKERIPFNENGLHLHMYYALRSRSVLDRGRRQRQQDARQPFISELDILVRTAGILMGNQGDPSRSIFDPDPD